MSSIFSDEQRTSLIDSMTNPESNARKMIEQNADIGMPSDLTTEILNKYATYGANTGIGNVGGGRLVDALNEQYRNRVDAPLNEISSPLKASAGVAVPALPNIAELLDLERLTSLDSIQDLAGLDAAQQLEMLQELNTDATLGADSVSVSDEVVLEDFNSPPTTEGRIGIDEMGSAQEGKDIASPTDLSELEVDSRMETIKKYLKDNPLVAKQIADSTGSFMGIAIKELIGEDKTEPVFRAPKARFQTSRVNVPTIGRSEGGATAGAAVPMGIMSIASGLGSLLGQMLVSPDDTKQVIAAVKPANHPTSEVSIDPIEMEDGGTVLNRKMFLGGGEIDGPGGEKEDLVPIWASPNEYVVSAKGVRRMGGGDLRQGIAALDKINFGDEQYG